MLVLLIVCALALMIWPDPLLAQAPRRAAALRVAVVDATGASIVGATVDVSKAGASTVLRTQPTDARGQAVIDGLPAGAYDVRVKLMGFTDFVAAGLALKPGANRLDATLQIANLSTTVTVAPDEQAAAVNPNGDTMTTTLGEEQLDALPEDETDLQQLLGEMAGADAEISVNGFVGGNLPPKSQIQQVRIRRNDFSADRHGRGGSRVEIVTRPGTQQWRSSLSFGFRDESMNARNAFAATRPPERQNRGRVSIQGPIVKNKTSVSLFVQGLSAYDSATIRAATPAGVLNGLVRQPEQQHNVSVRVEQALGPANILRVEYRDRRDDNENEGVGDFSLPEHGYEAVDASRRVRLSTSGTLGGGTYNELTVQSAWGRSSASPLTAGPAIRVLDTMTTGGATERGTQSDRTIDLQEKLDFTHRRHALSTGGQFQWTRFDSTRVDNGNGTFTFSTLDDYEAGRPRTYTQWIGNPAVAFPMFTGAWFVQDDVTVRKGLVASAGLRNEWQAHLRGTWNPAPRLGITWAPFKNGKTTVRGGYGLFHDWYDASVYGDTLQTDGARGQQISIDFPGYPDPYAGGDALFLPSGRVVASPNLELPAIRQTSIGIEQRFGAGLRADITYMHRSGGNLMRGRNLNAPGAGGLRPDPNAGNVIEIESIGRMRDDQIRTSVSGRVPWRNAFVSFRYTYGRSFDDGSGPEALPADNAAPDEWGPASDDVRHDVSMFAVADLFEALQAGVNVRAQSAPPYTITTGTDDNGDTVFNDRPFGVGRNSARGSGQFRLDVRLTYRIGIGAAAPRAQRQPRGGNGRRGGRPDWRMEHRALVEFYVRATNVLNTVNDTGYRGTLTSPFFGEPTSARAPRQVEVGTIVNF